MKRINNYIEKNIIQILTLFIIANPILDILTSININYLHWDFTIGMFVRFIFMTLFVYYIIFIKSEEKKIQKITLYVLLATILFSTVFTFNVFIKDTALLTYEIKNLLKYLYFIISYLFFLSIKKKLNSLNTKYINIAFLLYLFFIFVPNLFRGLNTYDYAKLGKTGLFNSANEISAIISIIFPTFLYSALKSKKKIIWFVLSMIYLSIVFNIGTKVPLFALVITLIIFISVFYIKAFKSKNKSLIRLSTVSMIVIFGSLLFITPQTTFYKNIKIHMDYFNINSFTDIFSSKENVDNIIFSERLTLVDNNVNQYKNCSIIEKIIGQGYYKMNNNIVIERKIAEIDYIDIFVSYGIVGTIIFVYILFISIKSLINNRKLLKDKLPLYIINYILILLIALFAGHVFTSPAVSIYVALFMVIPKLGNKKIEKKKILFCANTLTLGGIENALVNLTNIIDYDKYDVTLVLEHKSGEFLNRINKRIRIIDYNLSTSKIINCFKRIKWILINYQKYDFSCCYATYSRLSAKLALVSSKNNSIVVHTDNTLIYTKEEFIKFYASREIDKFKNIIFVSNEMRDNLLNYFPELKNKCHVINNIINNNEIIEKSKEKCDFKFKKDNIYFYFVGRLEECSKRLSLMLDAFNKLISNNKKINLLIIGKGPDEKKYQKYVKINKLQNNIHFLGYQSNPYKYMRYCNSLIMTSIIEGFPVTMLESLILNKNIVSTLNFSDNNFNMKDYGYITSSNIDDIVDTINKIIKEKKIENNIDFNLINQKNYKEFKKIMDGE